MHILAEDSFKDRNETKKSLLAKILTSKEITYNNADNITKKQMGKFS